MEFCLSRTGYPSESALSSKWHAWFASRCLGRRLSTWQMTAVLFLTVPNAHCGQRTFRHAWCHEHSAATVTELLQPPDPACGSLFQFNYTIRTSPTDSSGDSGGTLFSGSMNTMALCDFDMRRLRRTLTYLLTRAILASSSLAGLRPAR